MTTRVIRDNRGVEKMHSISRSICLLAVVAGTVACTSPSSTPAREQACIQRTAEEMLARADDIAVTGTGPADPENGVRILSMSNMATGRTADCYWSDISETVTRVQLGPTIQ
jgi:hypothetical protein